MNMLLTILLIIVGALVQWGGWTDVWTGMRGHLSLTQSQMTAGAVCLIVLLALMVIFLLVSAKIPKLICSLHSTAFYGLLLAAMFLDDASWGLLGKTGREISEAGVLKSIAYLLNPIGCLLIVVLLLAAIFLVVAFCALPYFFGGMKEDGMYKEEIGDILFDYGKDMVLAAFGTGLIFTFLNAGTFSHGLYVFGIFFFIENWMISQYNIFAPKPYEIIEKEKPRPWTPSGKYIDGAYYLSQTNPTSPSYFDGTSPTLTSRDHDDLDMLQKMSDSNFADGM